MKIHLAGEEVELYPGRALHWPADRSLFIADPHFGKTAAFRSFGIPVPDGTRQDLLRLEGILSQTGAERLVVLGDFFHARQGLSATTLEELANWRARHPQLEIILVRGNHDRHAGDPPSALRIHCTQEPRLLGPWVLCHIPIESPDGHVLAGHIHPGVSLRDRGGARLRAACFVTNPHRTILPAFGGFTGLETLKPQRNERMFAVTTDEVIEL